MTEEEKEEMELTRFGSVVVNSLSLSGKLQGEGWYKGDAGNGGGFDTYYHHDYDTNAELVFSGDFIGCTDTDVAIYEVHFGQAVAPAAAVEETVTGEALRIAPCKLGEADPRYFSETILQITRATATPKEKRPYPQCKKPAPDLTRDRNLPTRHMPFPFSASDRTGIPTIASVSENMQYFMCNISVFFTFNALYILFRDNNIGILHNYV